MFNLNDEEKLDLINEEIMIISSIHNILHDSILYREFNFDKNIMGDYEIIMDIMTNHLRKIRNLF